MVCQASRRCTSGVVSPVMCRCCGTLVDQMCIRRRLESVATDRDSRVGDTHAAPGLVLE
jgi:hypothetical protein